MQKLVWILFYGILSYGFWQCSAAAEQSSSNSETAIALASPPNIRVKITGLNTGMVRLVGMLNDQQYVVDVGADHIAKRQS